MTDTPDPQNAAANGSGGEPAPEPAGTPGDGGTAAVRCGGLWKVFGREADRVFARADARDREAHLRAAGCIPAVCDVGFEVPRGDIFVIMGLSGSGKSTLVRCLSRLIEPTAGSVELRGIEVTGMAERELRELRRRRIGMVFQNFGLMPYLTVLENVAFPLRVQGMARRERFERAAEVVTLVGLEGREWSYPHELSGGQQQRVGIARSLAVNPEIWLLDEPFSALDPLIRRQMQDEFLRLQRLLNKTIVFITHDFLEAVRLADRVAIMRAGRIVQIDRPSRIVLSPADDYVAEFVQDIPVGRVVRAGEIVERRAESTPLDDPIAADARIDSVIRRLSHAPGPVAVTDADGVPIGQITLARALDVVDRPAGMGVA